MSEELSHEQVERIIRRAIEIDEHDRGADGAGFSLDAVVDAADEVGVSRASLLESAAIERLGARPSRGVLDPLVGEAVIVYERRVGASAGDALRLLDEWLTSGHHLGREVLDESSGVWRRRRDVVASVQRRAKSMAGGARLGEVRRIDAVVSAVDTDAAIVRVIADRRVGRTAGIVVGTGVGAGSVVAAGVATAAAASAAMIVVPGVALAGAAAAITRHGGTKLERQLARLLDRVAAGEPVPRIGSTVANRLGLR